MTAACSGKNGGPCATRTHDPLVRNQVLYPLSYEGIQAGRAGFEPAVEFYPDNRLAGGPNQPLWHLPG